jgi:hypothetical protein
MIPAPTSTTSAFCTVLRSDNGWWSFDVAVGLLVIPGYPGTVRPHLLTSIRAVEAFGHTSDSYRPG